MPRLRVNRIKDIAPRPHLVGWGEAGPMIADTECLICGAEKGASHTVITLGIEETLSILGYLPRAMRGEVRLPAL